MEKQIICHKITKPNISLSDIGDMFGMSKQAIAKHIEKICEFLPVFTNILRNRQEFNKWRKAHEVAQKAGKLKRGVELEQLKLFEVDE